MFYILFIISFFLTYSLIPILTKFGKKLNFVDIPDGRKIHNKPLVRIGGLGIFLTYILIMCCLKHFFNDNFFSETNNLFSVLLISNIFILILGLLDDLYSLSPFIRLIVQFFIYSFVWINNIKIESINFYLFDNLNSIFLPSWLSLLFSAIVIIGIMNAINWLDGLDGLAAGIAIFMFFSIYALNQNSQNEIVNLSLPILIGSCLAFLKFNFYPSKILMGDSGSNFLGFNLSLLALISTRNILPTDLSLKDSYSTNIDIFFIIFLIPILDMSYVIFKRLLDKKSPFYPDKSHLHHRMLKIGFKHLMAVLNIYLYSITNTFLIIYIINKNNVYLFIVISGIILSISKLIIQNKSIKEQT